MSISLWAMAAMAHLASPATPTLTNDAVCLPPMAFRAATVYAASTDYYFANRAGEDVRIRLVNLETEGSGFERLTAFDESGEGPPGENPAMVGRSYRICFDGLEILALPAD